MKKIEKINEEIAQLKIELENVQGTSTEVYARIVGYYRSVKNWNRGKKEEYRFRKDFNAGKACDAATTTRSTEVAAIKMKNQNEMPVKKKIEKLTINAVKDASEAYLYFYRNSCPNCAPVKNYLKSLRENTIEINVDTADGLKLAAKYDVMATPTAIWFDNEGNEMFRGSSVNSLTKAVELAC